MKFNFSVVNKEKRKEKKIKSPGKDDGDSDGDEVVKNAIGLVSTLHFLLNFC